ncbi:hypothetical protein KZX29_00240 [Moraxella osloensis]|uniref:hypothetical protein n=1 Tax=Faucicola osloensis TaxID=34062 RepID=UPI00200374CB|nr:hypothetical protein [Moraxella osloensis]MCK6157236.1 hypothetical protein [Moraxella osloensis]
MKERPIIFSGEMVTAILDGKKTMTRRLVKFKDFTTDSITPLHIELVEGRYCLFNERNGWVVGYPKCPYGKIGDRLWVRETWIEGYDDPLIESEGDDENAVSIIYKADGKEEYRTCSAETAENWGDFSADSEMVGFKSPIHMPRWASRILLEITDIRVERLQDITEADAIKEGLGSGILRDCKVPKFSSLWDSLYQDDEPKQWKNNPWVWVIEFKKVKNDKPSD